MTLIAGKPAPNFKLKNDQDELISLDDLRGKNIILYFYPKDDTPGCTKEACNFKDNLPRFDKLNAVILGVSKDDVKSHQKFKQKFQLPFSLLADTTGEMCEKYGVMAEKSMFGKKYMGIERTTFLIDGQGIIRNIWPKVTVDQHVEEVSEALQQLK